MLFPNPDNLLTHLLDQELVMGLGKGRGCPHTDGFSHYQPLQTMRTEETQEEDITPPPEGVHLQEPFTFEGNQVIVLFV